MADPRDEFASLVEVLGSSASREAKQEAGRKLVEAGKAAIPVLIGCLRDGRLYESRDIANRMNLPATAPPPKPLVARITVGERCEQLLYRIITPVHASPFAGNFKVISEQVLRVLDWPAWWAANQQKSLDQIHAELRPLVDQYWNQHGTTQNVPAGNWLESYLGQQVTVRGTTVNLKTGAQVITEHGGIYIDGLESWPRGYDSGRTVTVKGTLIKRYDLPVFVESPSREGVQRAGIPVPPGTDLHEAAKRYLLTNASWEIVK